MRRDFFLSSAVLDNCLTFLTEGGDKVKAAKRVCYPVQHFAARG